MRVSEAPTFPASYLTNEPTKGPLRCLQGPIQRERWHVHMQLSPVYSEACVRVLSQVILCTFPVHSRSASIFPLHTHQQIAEGRV